MSDIKALGSAHPYCVCYVLLLIFVFR